MENAVAAQYTAGRSEISSAKRRRFEDAGWALVMLLPGALTVFLSFNSGGFYVGATGLAATEMALVVGLRFALARRPAQGVGPALLIAVAAIGCLAAWTLLSVDWSAADARALPEYARALLYGLVLLFFGMLPFEVRRIRWMVYGLAAGVVIVCAAAIVARLLPHVIFDSALVRESRLAYPLTYWNALGILACVGTVFCAHLACSTRDPRPVRILAAAAVPLLALTLYYTLSRGGIWAAAGALALYVLIGRPRALLSGIVATVPPTLIALAAAIPSDSVTHGYPDLTVSAGKHVAATLFACMAGAAVLRACLLPLDAWLDRLRLPRLQPAAVAAGVGAAVALVLVVAVAAGMPGAALSKYHEFTDRSDVNPTAGESRLFSARPEGRFDLWDVALEAFRRDRLRGTGAGTYEISWNRDRPAPAKVENAHSLYLEVLSELGVVGLGLLLIALGSILVAFAYRARGPDRALFAAMLAAGLAWAAHAGVDWDWQMPAVTAWIFALGGAALARSLRRRRRRDWVDLKMTLLRVGGVLTCLLLALLPARLALSDSHLNQAIEDVARGDCRGARAESTDSLADVSQRPIPYETIAFCDLREGRYRRAMEQMRQALRRDPENWELEYGLAIARAGAGLSPVRASRRAARLNPLDKHIAELPPAMTSRAGRAAWRRAARETTPLPPELGDP